MNIEMSSREYYWQDITGGEALTKCVQKLRYVNLPLFVAQMADFVKIPLHLMFFYNLQQGPLCLLRVTSNDCKCPSPERREEQILWFAGTLRVLLLIGGLT